MRRVDPPIRNRPGRQAEDLTKTVDPETVLETILEEHEQLPSEQTNQEP
ncbi:MAG TPA: hypothetical protein VMF67_06665 [Rhizomicrobium sp.]|nr:hypothetical protein [Rhizomicrobium sp.]